MQPSTFATSLRDYLRILFHRKWYIVFFTLTSVVGFFVYAWFVAPVVYEAGNHLLIHDQNMEPLQPGQTVSPFHVRMNRVFDRIQSSDGVREVLAGVDSLAARFAGSPTFRRLRWEHLEERRGFLMAKVEIANVSIRNTGKKIAEYETGGRRGTELVADILYRRDQAQRERTQALRQLVLVQRQIKAFAEGHPRLVAGGPDSAVAEDPLAGEHERRFHRMALEVKEELTVGMRGSRIVVSARSSDPGLAVEIADRVLEQVEMVHKRLIQGEVSGAVDQVEWQEKLALEELEALRREKMEFERKHGLIYRPEPSPAVAPTGEERVAVAFNASAIPSGPNASQQALELLHDWKAQEAALRAELRALDNEIAALAREQSRVPQFVGSVEHQDGVLTQKLRESLAALYLEEARLSVTHAAEHPELARVRKQIRSIAERLDTVHESGVETQGTEPNPKYEEMSKRVSDKQVQRAGLLGKLETVELNRLAQQRVVDALPRIETEHEIQVETIGNIKSDVRLLQGKLRDADRTQKNLEAGGGVVFTRPEPTRYPQEPVEPKKALLLFMGLIIGLFFSAAAVFFVEYADHSIKGIEDVRRFLGLPVLGVILDYEMYKDSSRRLFRWRGGTTVKRLIVLVGFTVAAMIVLVALVGDDEPVPAGVETLPRLPRAASETLEKDLAELGLDMNGGWTAAEKTTEPAAGTEDEQAAGEPHAATGTTIVHAIPDENPGPLPIPSLE